MGAKKWHDFIVSRLFFFAVLLCQVIDRISAEDIASTKQSPVRFFGSLRSHLRIFRYSDLFCFRVEAHTHLRSLAALLQSTSSNRNKRDNGNKRENVFVLFYLCWCLRVGDSTQFLRWIRAEKYWTRDPYTHVLRFFFWHFYRAFEREKRETCSRMNISIWGFGNILHVASTQCSTYFWLKPCSL